MSKTQVAEEAAKGLFTLAKDGIASAYSWLSEPSMRLAKQSSEIGIGNTFKKNYYAPDVNKVIEKDGILYKKGKNGKRITKKDADGNKIKNEFVEADLSDYNFQYGKAIGDGLRTGAFASGTYGAVKGTFTNDNEKFDLPGIPFI